MPKKCSWCKGKKELIVNTPIYSFCSYDCASAMAKEKKLKSSKKKARELAEQSRIFDRETRRLKETIKPKSKWLSELQSVFNQYIRFRDADSGCISCDKGAHWQGQFHIIHAAIAHHCGLICGTATSNARYVITIYLAT